jgi:ArpU family phage transcriptional regulator
MGALKEASKARYRKPLYRKMIEQLLKQYPVFKKAIENRTQTVLSYYFSPNNPLYDSKKKVEYQPKTSKQRRSRKNIQVTLIEEALRSLDIDERMLIEEVYFNPERVTVDVICERFGWSRRSYFRLKSRAIEKLACALNLI